MKIFKWWHKLIIIVCLAIIATLFLLVSFLSKIEDVQRWSLFASMFFGVATIALSFIALAISMQTFVKTNRQEKENLQNEAEQFIIDHNDEIEYIPLCIIANCYDKHRKYKRDIYVEFNKLRKELKSEVLSQLNYEIGLIDNINWLRDAQSKIESFIKEYEMGEDFLFEYFEKSLKYSDDDYSEEIESLRLISSSFLGLPKLRFSSGNCIDEGITFSEYVSLYLHTVINNDFKKGLVPKPLDELISRAQLTDSDEKSVCLWTLYAVDTFADLIMKKPDLRCDGELFPLAHANIETFEDKFLLSLAKLYNLSKFKNQ